jgi:hypothetical protein
MSSEAVHEVFFGSWDELVTARERLLTEGWDVQARDDLERGVRGFSALKGGEPRTHLKWLPWCRELSAKVTVCSTWREFVREIEFRVSEEMEKCDAMEASQVGFVSYGRASTSGVSEVFRISVVDLQKGGQEARDALTEVLGRSKHPGGAPLKAILGRSPGPGGR